MSEADIDSDIQAEFDISELIEVHEETDWSAIPEIDGAEAAAWVERLKEAQEDIRGSQNGTEAAVTASEYTSTASAYALAGGEEYADVAAEYRVRGPTTDQRIELIAETAFGEVALTLDRTEAEAVYRALSVAVAHCGPADSPE